MLAESTGQSPEQPESTELALLLHKENLGLLEGSLGAQREGKEGRGRSGGRSGCRGARLQGQRGSGAVEHWRGTGGGGGAP
jgi:hypothetical protein